MHNLHSGNIRTLPRTEFVAFRRNARKGGCSYRYGLFYVSRYGVEPCDSSGCFVQSRAMTLRHVAACRAEGRYKAARDILALLQA